MQPNTPQHDPNKDPRHLSRLGISFLAVGISFGTLAITGQIAFIASGAAFITLGIVFLAKARKGSKDSGQ